MNEKICRKKVNDGYKLEHTLNTEGYTEVLLPRIKALLAEADRKCHPTSSTFKEDVLKYHVGVYNGVKSVMDEIELIIHEKNNSIKYLNDNGFLDK